ncbi:hypothetical protein OS242_10445 [Tumebacillus sp. DT12]|uniref:Uncharacterized protein n=1 Tax=Tumebacillus lacus TaxID=2995335 RepID=A0ABT3X338_9BACL|nr:hypothetical protein [Tumebacillus lacus]MCX7570383.1 hypothetical protein [Tumebacillus lacus]
MGKRTTAQISLFETEQQQEEIDEEISDEVGAEDFDNDDEPAYKMPVRRGNKPSPRTLCFLNEEGDIAHKKIEDGDTSYDQYMHGQDYGYIIVYHPNILLAWQLQKEGKFVPRYKDRELRIDQRYLA